MFFKVIRIAAAFSILLGIVGCSSYPQKSPELPKGEPLVSIMITRAASHGPVNAPNGWAFYVKRPPPSMTPILYGYDLRGGNIHASISGGWESKEVVEAIDEIDFEPFDWKSEAAIADARRDKALQGETVVVSPFAFDGAEFEIIINNKRGRFCMREWNPGIQIKCYAPYSEKIAKLKRVIDTLALYAGLNMFGLF